MLNFRKKAYSLYLALLTFIELYLYILFFILVYYCKNSFQFLINCLVLVLSFPFFNTIYFYSVLLDSKLLASSSEDSSKNKPSIYEKEMEEKKTSFLTEDEYEKEKYQDAEGPINSYSENEVVKKLNK